MAKPMLSPIDPSDYRIFKTAEVASIELADAPIPPAWIIGGTPRARAGAIAHSPDGWASSVVWECTAGSFNWQFGWEETVFILEGSVRIIAETGEEKILKAGDAAYFAQGTSSEWHIDSYLRKIAFTRNREPGNVRKPLSQLRGMRDSVRGAAQSFSQHNVMRKLVTAAVGVGGTLALFSMVVEM